MEVSVAGTDTADTVFTHYYRGMQVVHQVAANVRQFRKRLRQDRLVTIGWPQEREAW